MTISPIQAQDCGRDKSDRADAMVTQPDTGQRPGLQTNREHSPRTVSLRPGTTESREDRADMALQRLPVKRLTSQEDVDIYLEAIRKKLYDALKGTMDPDHLSEDEQMNKNAIQKYAVWARNELIGQVKQRAFQYGINEGCGDGNAAIITGACCLPTRGGNGRSLSSR